MRQFPGGVPASYPPGKHPTLDDPATYAKLDTEALFFAFYYQPGSYQQFLAAKELKRQSWRYHKGQRSWFQVRLPLPACPPIDTQEFGCRPARISGRLKPCHVPVLPAGPPGQRSGGDWLEETHGVA